MKRSQNDVGTILDRLLSRHGSPSPERMKSAIDRVQERLRSGDNEFAEAPPSARRSNRMWLAAAAAIAVLVIGVSVLVRTLVWSGDAFAAVESGSGPVSRLSGGKTEFVKPGEQVAAGQILRTHEGSSSIKVADSSVEMHAQSEISLEPVAGGVRVQLNKGSVTVNAREGTGHVYVKTKDALVSAKDSVFLVAAEFGGSRVAVMQGEVRTQQGAAEKTLQAGEQMATAPRAKFEVISIRRTAPVLGLESIADGESLGFACHGVDGVVRAPYTGGPQLVVPQGRCLGNRVSLALMINYAYRAPWKFGPDVVEWARLDADSNQISFHVEAVALNPSTVKVAELREMLQTMLADRFQMRVHREKQEIQGYAFRIAKGGSKLKEASGDVEHPSMQFRVGIKGKSSLNELAAFLTDFMTGFVNMRTIDYTFVNETGLTGIYEYQFRMMPRGGTGARGENTTGPPSREQRLAGIADAISSNIEDDYGIRLQHVKVSTDVLIVDHVEKPADN